LSVCAKPQGAHQPQLTLLVAWVAFQRECLILAAMIRRDMRLAQDLPLSG
jgi:hypothetical protein